MWLVQIRQEDRRKKYGPDIAEGVTPQHIRDAYAEKQKKIAELFDLPTPSSDDGSVMYSKRDILNISHPDLEDICTTPALLVGRQTVEEQSLEQLSRLPGQATSKIPTKDDKVGEYASSTQLSRETARLKKRTLEVEHDQRLFESGPTQRVKRRRSERMKSSQRNSDRVRDLLKRNED